MSSSKSSSRKRDVLVPEGCRAYALKSVKVELKAGQEFWYCECGLSANQPFCDASHKSLTGEHKVLPTKYVVEQSDSTDPPPPGVVYIKGPTERRSMCQCKCTRNPPFCDGIHSKVDLLGNQTVLQEREQRARNRRLLRYVVAPAVAVLGAVGGFFLFRRWQQKKKKNGTNPPEDS